MTETEQREAFVEHALSWMFTPFVHRAEVVHGGVDCAHLVSGAIKACDTPATERVKNFSWPKYSPDWFRHQKDPEAVLVENLKKLMGEVTTPQPGDIAVLKFGTCYCHCAIVIAWPRKILEAWPARSYVATVDPATDPLWSCRDVRFFSPWSEPK